MPADSTTARTAPPAMSPVPSGAGFSSTLPEPNLPTTWCGIVVPFSGTRMRLFFAASIPFLIADGTVAVTDDYQGAEAQVLAALHDLRNSIDRDDGVLDLDLGGVHLLPVII